MVHTKLTQYRFMVSSLYFFLIPKPRNDLVLSLQLQQGQHGFPSQCMKISHTLHLFCPSLYLDGILGFLLALYLSQIPLQLNYYISGELIQMGNKYFIAFLPCQHISYLHGPQKTHKLQRFIFQRNSLVTYFSPYDLRFVQGSSISIIDTTSKAQDRDFCF